MVAFCVGSWKTFLQIEYEFNGEKNVQYHR